MTCVEEGSRVISGVDADADGGSESDDGVGPHYVLRADRLLGMLARGKYPGSLSGAFPRIPASGDGREF